MNAVSQALRIIAIVAALAAAGLYFLSEKKAQKASAAATQASAQVAAANKAAADAQAKLAAATDADTALQKQIDDQKTKDSGYETLLAQARSDASNATHAVADKDQQIQDLTTQVASLKQQAAQVDDLKQQLATAQAAAKAPAATTDASASTSGTATAAAGNTTATTPVFSTTPVPLQIVELDAKHGLIVVNTGTSAGLATDAELVLQKSGNKVAQIQVTDAEPDYSVAMILTGSTPKQLKQGETVDYLRIR